MSAALRAYPAYKDSGVEWLGRVPDGWRTERLKQIAKNIVDPIDSATIDGPRLALEDVEGWTGRVRARVDRAFTSALKRFGAGDVLFGKLRPYLAKVACPATSGGCVGEFLVLRATVSMIDPSFLAPLLRSASFIHFVNSSTFGAKMPRAEWSVIGNAEVPVPPLPEQRQIAAYLAHADRRISRLIAAKRRLIALLEEQKQAVIQHAVTRGLDPNARLRPSGVPWLGDVPEGWEVVRLGRIIELVTGFPFKSDGFSTDPTDTRLLRGINISPGRLRWENSVRWPSADVADYARYSLKAGDLVLGMDRPVIGAGTRVAEVTCEDLPCILLQRVARMRPLSVLGEQFLKMLLAGPDFADHVAPIFTGISVPHVSPEQIRNFAVPLPPLSEQTGICRAVEQRTAALEATAGRARREIDLLREYRARLIADVVTGKLDVRGVELGPLADDGRGDGGFVEPEDADGAGVEEGDDGGE